MVAHRETASLAEELIGTTCERERIARNRLTIHADRGSSMTSKRVALMRARKEMEMANRRVTLQVSHR
jgi:putative transposase